MARLDLRDFLLDRSRAAAADPEGAKHAALVMVVDDDPNARGLLAATVPGRATA